MFRISDRSRHKSLGMIASMSVDTRSSATMARDFCSPGNCRIAGRCSNGAHRISCRSGRRASTVAFWVRLVERFPQDLDFCGLAAELTLEFADALLHLSTFAIAGVIVAIDGNATARDHQPAPAKE